MITDPPQPEAAGNGRRRGRLPAVTSGWRNLTAEHVRTLTIRGRALRVAVREGNGQLPPLLLCNGIGASLELLQPFVDVLEPQRTIIRFDLPGVGGSPPPVFPYHKTTLAPMLAGLLDQLGHQQADVLGISWGGGLAQQFALRYPSRVRRLVLVATGTGALMVPAHPRVLLRMLTPRRYRDAGYVASIAGELYGGSVRASPKLAADLLHATMRRGPGRGYYYQLLASAGWTSLPLLPLLRQPTLILAGDDDPIIPLVNARIMHRLINRSELTIYHGGHLELVSEPELMAPIVEEFLNVATKSAADSAGAVLGALGRRERPGRHKRCQHGGCQTIIILFIRMPSPSVADAIACLFGLEYRTGTLTCVFSYQREVVRQRSGTRASVRRGLVYGGSGTRRARSGGRV